MNILVETGDFLIGFARGAGRGILLALRAAGELPRAPAQWRKVVRQLFTCGVAALPVVTITALFSGMVISGQTSAEMRRQLNDIFFVGSLVGSAMVREMGPVLTAVMIAGLVGGGMASVLATMRVNEEIDALEVMSIDPVRFLILPRLVAMLIAAPLLTVYADLVGIWGGALVAHYNFDVSYAQFYHDCWEALRQRDLFFGLLKALVFGGIITAVSCDQGFAAEGGAEGVGRATMRSVVYSFLLILIANYLLFSLVYQRLLMNGAAR